MTDATAIGIRQISLVCVPTPDQDKAIEFYQSVGFEKRTDTPFGGGYRRVEVYPPQGTTGMFWLRDPTGHSLMAGEQS